MFLPNKSEKEIRESLKSTYDHIVTPPSWDELNHIIKKLPRHFQSVNLEQVADRVISNFGQFDPLVWSLSQENKDLLKSSIMIVYGTINFKDLEEGGDGRVVPTFFEIMRCYYVRNTHHEKKHLKTNEDKQFYSKYKWAWDQYCLIAYDESGTKKVS